jgi:hypothetical protein
MPMGWLKSVANNNDSRSWAHRARLKRFQHFIDLTENLDRPFRILDVGGTPGFWTQMGFSVPPGCEIVLLNLGQTPPGALPGGMRRAEGDGTDLTAFPDAHFTVAFSNSVIEHVGDFAKQKSMADEVQRVSQFHFVQTPNFWFFLEPHFLLPGIHWLPAWLRARVVYWLRPGWYGRSVGDLADARATVDSIRLLTRAELRRLFPRSKLVVERWFGLKKSFIAIGRSQNS